MHDFELKSGLHLDEAWQFWFSPFFKLRSLISGLLPSDVKNAATTTILHKYVTSTRFGNMFSNFDEGAPVFWSRGRCASFLEHQDRVVPPS
jgi:hypothetical protein